MLMQYLTKQLVRKELKNILVKNVRKMCNLNQLLI